MHINFFVLGANHTLSKIDIINILFKKGIEIEILGASEELLIVKTERGIEASSLINELGSAVKIGEVFRIYAKEDFFDSFLKDVIKEDFNRFFLPNGAKNVCFGISVYGGGGKFKDVNEVFYRVSGLEREIKEKLEKIGFRVNYIKRREKELSSVIVNKKNLLRQGFEIVLGVGEKEVYVGKTLAIQDYKSYSLRDYGRPARDPRAGMIPPKLAKILINLVLKDKDKTMLDPFCGSGTILQEEVLLGYKNLIGSDSSEKSIKDTQTNLNWLFEKFNLNRENYLIRVFKEDVQKIASKINFKTVDAIITEPYLGSPRAKSFHLGLIEKEIVKLGRLYLAAFGEFKKVLRDDGVVAIIFPVFRFGGQFYHLDIMDGIYALGFKKRELLINKPLGFEKLNLKLTSRGGVIFFRPGQTVSREIFVFEKN